MLLQGDPNQKVLFQMVAIMTPCISNLVSKANSFLKCANRVSILFVISANEKIAETLLNKCSTQGRNFDLEYPVVSLYLKY